MNSNLEISLFIKKFKGKGGWMYLELPESFIPKTYLEFGMVTVSGKVDEVSFKHKKLMPIGNGNLMLPLNKEFRKKLNKTVGDQVNIVVFEDHTELEIPEDLVACLKFESTNVYEKFMSFPNSMKNQYITWIFSATKQETKEKRMAEAITKIIQTQ